MLWVGAERCPGAVMGVWVRTRPIGVRGEEGKGGKGGKFREQKQ